MWAQCNHKVPYKWKGGKKDLKMLCHWLSKWRKGPQATGRKPLEAGKGKVTGSPEGEKEQSSPDTLILSSETHFELVPSRTVRQHVSY